MATPNHSPVLPGRGGACSYDTLSKRVTDGWSDFMAITTPTIRGRPPKNFDKAATNG